MLESSISNFHATELPALISEAQIVFPWISVFEIKDEIKYVCSKHFQVKSYQNMGTEREGKGER